MAARGSRDRHDSGVEIDSDGSTTMSLGSPPHRNHNAPNSQLDEGIIDAPAALDLFPHEVKVLEISRPQQMETCPLEGEGFGVSALAEPRVAQGETASPKNFDTRRLQQSSMNARLTATVDRINPSCSFTFAKGYSLQSSAERSYLPHELSDTDPSLPLSAQKSSGAPEDASEQSGKCWKRTSRSRLARKRVNQMFLQKPGRMRDDTAFLIAAADNNVAVCEELLKQGARVNARDESSRTALHFAATIRTGAPLVNMLIRHGANPNFQDAAGNTPLHLAICINNEPVMQELLRSGSDLTAVDRSGRNPMQLATSRLRLIQLETSSGKCVLSETIRNETLKMITCLKNYLKERETSSASVASVFSAFQEKFFASKSPEQFSSDVSDLLSSLEQLQLL
ncbi:ankyrin repeat domain-containing protein 54-like [Tropilaelaps mercedesae]|uniref:Ankyrin repeat domain-containing protein 54-like n=1 Tax=Tropilaelaps mercedesae TaxID=418985 RepID=A0A1V9XWD3_9ACAR|nr:ankyrin repeat domain-containing protein 54-like [Tropilaelaps mercedesae]